jgi:hypothetical protein
MKSKVAKQQAPSLAMAVALCDQSAQLVQATRAFLETAPPQDRGFFAKKILGEMDTTTVKDLHLWSRKISRALKTPQVSVPRDKKHAFWSHRRPENTRHKVPVEERDDIGCFVQEHLVCLIFFWFVDTLLYFVSAL